MTRDEAVKMIQQVLGYRADLQASIISTMQAEQENLELGPTKPWFLLSEDATTTTITGQRVPLPSDFLCEAEDSALIYVPDDVTEEEYILGKRDLDKLLKKWSSIAQPEPQYPQEYAIKGEYFIIFPDPGDVEYTLRMAYYRKAAKLDSNIANEWLTHAWKLLCGVTGQNIAASIRDGSAFKIFSSWAQEGRLAMFARNEDREHAGRDDYQMGGAE